jgi:hypothetical protein
MSRTEITGSQILDGTIKTIDIADANITYAKIQNVSATDKVLGRSTADAGVVEEITCTSTGRKLIGVTSIGTSGQVLTSNGASTLPTFQDVPGSSGDAIKWAIVFGG